jgi:hypothetical protein
MSDTKTLEDEVGTLIWAFDDATRKEAVRALARRIGDVERELAIAKQEQASISAELELPPTIRPAEGEIRRMLEGWKTTTKQKDALLTALKGLSGQVNQLDGDSQEWMDVFDAVHAALALCGEVKT